MADIEVVVKIPEEVYEGLVYLDIFQVRNLIQSGTPLPKGHGKLIDADKIEWYGCDFEDGAVCRRNRGNCGICTFAECDANQVRNLPTIIEADKEG